MAKVKKVAYVVFKGRAPGLYISWDECNAQVERFSKADFLGYATLEEAERAWSNHERSQSASAATDEQPPDHSSYTNSNGTANGRTSAAMAPLEPAHNLKRSISHEYIVISSDDEEEARGKKPKVAINCFRDNVDFIPFDEREEAMDLDVKEIPFQLTTAQQAVVEMAVKGDNIFLTGAAGSGKTATLKEILRRLKDKYSKRAGPGEIGDIGGSFPQVQVVAPTGIAALPLNGRTTYSFAGWNMDSFKQPQLKLFGNVSKRVCKTMANLKVLIIEEISMVENQFLERLNLLMQYVLHSTKPFGGRQVIFLGDFHQLPPVKPFEFCLYCGEPMINLNVRPVCNSNNCSLQGVPFTLGDKWAFKASVWSQLKLRHVKLEQIHRQKDGKFQDVLNKIRNGVFLSDDEWNALNAKKEENGAFAVRLMSRRQQVKSFNVRQLSCIKSEPKSWEALDTAIKLQYTEDDKLHPRKSQILRDLEEHKDSLKDHRLPTSLVLKVGAKVVLLSNLNPEGGLVNGSQGEVVKLVNTESWPVKPPEGMENNKTWQANQARILDFHTTRGFWCPVVRFTNGKIITVQPVPQSSLRGPSHDRYLVSRTQIPLALAWALSIHKSQGMTLEHVEVSSNDIFESGQLYVGFSRATKLEGLTVTGYSREQLSMDQDVLEFYASSKWEDLGPANASKDPVVTRHDR